MKLTIKTLQQTSFKVDIEGEKTVKELKEQIESEHGKEFPSSAQKLIYSGKILADECKLSEYNIDEKKFIVLMITRPPPAPKVTPPSTNEKSTSSVKKEETATPSPGAKPKAEPKSTSTSQTSSSSTPALTTSNPATTTTAAPPPANRPSGRLAAPSDSPLSASLNEPQMASRLAAMMSQPHFRQIQDLIQQSPHLLSSTIEALAGSDPEMYSFISENPDVFVSALNHPPMAGSRGPASRGSTTTTTTTASGAQGITTGQQHGSGGVRSQAGRQQMDQIVVSEHDKEAIERLKELGFPEFLAIQAYIACDKDEQLAANLLFQMEQ